ncbi:MAG: MDR family MFS transporter [Archangium sp.]
MNAATLPQSRLAQLADGIPKPFWALLVGTFITKAGSFVMPLLFVYLTQVRGIELPIAGAITSLYGAGSLVGSLGGGIMADRYGRKFTMLVSLIVGACFLLLLGVSRGLPAIALATLLLGATADAYRPASLALSADLIAPQHRLKAFAMQYWAINLGFAVAAIVGGSMAKRNFSVLFIGDALTTVVLSFIVWKLIPESRPKPAADAPKAGSLFTPFVDKRFAPFLLFNFFIAVVFFQHLSTMPDDMKSKGLSTEEFGWAVASNGLLIVVLQPVVTRIAGGLRQSSVLAAASLLTGLGFGLYAFAHSLPAYVGCVAIWTLGELLFAPVNSTVVAQLSPLHLRGRYQGAFVLTWSTAAMAAPLIGASLIPKIGHDLIWVGCLAIGAAVTIGHMVFSARSLPKYAVSE